jgi:hypothetical protein
MKHEEEKSKFAHRAKITALHTQLLFEGKGIRVKSIVINNHQPYTRKQIEKL